VSVRPAELDDVAAIARLVIQLGYDASVDGTGAALRELLGRRDHALLVSPVSGPVLGWVHVHDVHRVGGESFAEVSGLVVDQSVRNSGIGSALMNAAEAWALERGLVTMRVRTNERRSGARRFYTNRAYEPVKSQIVFQKTLSNGDRA
jgi:GNAT superfamily N-acetyltransferase